MLAEAWPIQGLLGPLLVKACFPGATGCRICLTCGASSGRLEQMTNDVRMATCLLQAHSPTWQIHCSKLSEKLQEHDSLES